MRLEVNLVEVCQHNEPTATQKEIYQRKRVTQKQGNLRKILNIFDNREKRRENLTTPNECEQKKWHRENLKQHHQICVCYALLLLPLMEILENR